jgi:hypothetical protein
MARQAQDRLAFKQNVTALRHIETRKAIEERGLAGPIWADDAHDLAKRNIETDTVERNDAAEAYRDVPHTEQGRAANMGFGVQLGLQKHTAGWPRARSASTPVPSSPELAQDLGA